LQGALREGEKRETIAKKRELRKDGSKKRSSKKPFEELVDPLTTKKGLRESRENCHRPNQPKKTFASR
jgi:hypothetical protein